MIDIIIILIYVMLSIAVGSVLWSLFNSWRKRSKSIAEEQLAQRTSIVVVALVVVVVVVSLLFSSADPLRIAGKMYTETVWLRVADVCMFSIGFMLIISIVVAFAMMLFDGKRKKLSQNK